MERRIHKRPIRSGRYSRAAQPGDAAPAVTAAVFNPAIERTPRAGRSSSCPCWFEHDHRSAPKAAVAEAGGAQ